MFSPLRLIVVCGWPASGKTTIAKLLEERLNAGRNGSLDPRAHRVDNDDVRKICFGMPYPYPEESPELMKKDQMEMGGVYRILGHIAEWHLSERRSLILTASFSKRISLALFMCVYNAHLEEAKVSSQEAVALRIIQCLPVNDTREEIRARLRRKKFGHIGSMNSLERYIKVKDSYEPIELPHHKLDTSPPRTPDECADEALKYILT